jgi:tetratricopeptide (TPR) repeat protein
MFLSRLLSSSSPRKRGAIGWTVLLLMGTAAALGLKQAGNYVFQAYHQTVARHRCEASLAANDWKALEMSAEEWLDWDSFNGDAWLYLARAADELGMPMRAATALSKVPETHARVIPALRRQVELELGPANRPLSAEVALQRLLRCDPGNPAVHRQWIGFLAQTYQQTRLVQQIHESIAEQCEPPEAYIYLLAADDRMGLETLAHYERWNQGHPNCPIFLTARALCHANENPDDEETSGTLQTLLKRFGDNVEILAHHIEQSIVGEDVGQVAQLLDQAPPLSRIDHRFWRYAAWLHLQKGEPDEAEQAFHHAIQLHPLSWKTRKLFAEFLASTDRDDQSQRERQLAERGDLLSRTVRESVFMVPPSSQLLEQIADYAADCDDQRVVAGIQRHLIGSSPRFPELSQLK